MNVAEGIPEQLLHMEMQAIIEATKLAGLGAKNLMALVAALCMDNGENKYHPGAQSAKKLVQQGKPVTAFKIKEADLEQFKMEAKDAGLAYHPLRARDDHSGMYDIMAKTEDAAMINMILERLGYEKQLEDDTKNQSGPSPSTRDLTVRGATSTENQRTGPELNEVIDNSAALVSHPDLFKEYLEIQGRLPTYSEGNQNLIKEQFPDATMVMSKSDWYKCGRTIDEDAAPLRIKRPGFEGGKRSFTDMYVYDISGTIKASKPEYEPLTRHQHHEAVLQLVNSYPCAVERYEQGGPKGYDPESRCIYLDHSLDGEALLHHIIYESCHAHQHKAMGKHYDRETASAFVDCAAVQICASFDMDTKRYDLSAAADMVKRDPEAATLIQSCAVDLAAKFQCRQRSKYKQLAHQKAVQMER